VNVPSRRPATIVSTVPVEHTRHRLENFLAQLASAIGPFSKSTSDSGITSSTLKAAAAAIASRFHTRTCQVLTLGSLARD
jgi:hypothetical protein